MSKTDFTREKRGFEFEDRQPKGGDFLKDMLAGLARNPKQTPPKYFYDQRGAELFESICRTQEYYLTRTETALLEKIAPEIAVRAGAGARVVEFGSGSMEKIKILLRALQHPQAYIAIDIAKAQLLRQADALSAAFPAIAIKAICADFLQPLAPHWLDVGNGKNGKNGGNGSDGLKLGFLPGSTIGNFEGEEALTFMRAMHASLGKGSALLIGVDIKKDPKLLEAAYNDKEGMGEAFNRNLLTRMRRELGAELDEEDFIHEARYNEEAGRIEMRLRSQNGQRVKLGGQSFSFAPGEALHTESAQKYSPEEFQHFARKAGFTPSKVWQDEDGLFSIHWLDV